LKKQRITLILGGNQGNVLQTLDLALAKIKKQLGVVSKQSKLYTTEAWGNIPQPDFFNLVIELKTIKTPKQTLDIILKIEKQLGRERKERYGPRTIDIDILYYENRIISLNNLTIPHPEIQNRRFVLVPLNEINPKQKHPVLKQKNSYLLEKTSDKGQVKTWKTRN